MQIDAVKVKPNKSSTSAAPTAVTVDLDTDIKYAGAWLNFRENITKYFEEVDKVAVELQFESSYDATTFHTFNADEAVFVSDIRVSPDNNIVFVAPYGSKDKTFGVSESELINVTKDGTTEQLHAVVGRMFKESFKEVPDISTISMFERKQLSQYTGLGAMLNDSENYIKMVELTRDRSKLYSKLELYGIF